MSGNMQEMSPRYRFSHHNLMIPTFPVLRKCARHTKFPVCRKCAWNVTCPAFKYFIYARKCLQEMCLKCHVSWLQEMCLKFYLSWFRKCAWNSALYCTSKSQGNVKISWYRKCTRNVNFPGHFMGFPCPGNLGFLPVVCSDIYTVYIAGCMRYNYYISYVGFAICEEHIIYMCACASLNKN